MSKRSYAVDVHLDIHSIKCPGVWLCPKGHVSLALKLFRVKEKTKQMHPHFPLMVNQRFHFRKIYNGLNSFYHLCKILRNSFIKAELIQKPNATQEYIVLARFKASLMEIVNPEETMCEVDFLFATTDCFPGILAPKAEVSTRIVMEEFVSVSTNIEDIPVTITSKDYDKRPYSKKAPQRQRKVCHTNGAPCSCYIGCQNKPAYPRFNSRFEPFEKYIERQEEFENKDSRQSSFDSKQDECIPLKCSPVILCKPVVNNAFDDQPQAHRKSTSRGRNEPDKELLSDECCCLLCQRYELYLEDQRKGNTNRHKNPSRGVNAEGMENDISDYYIRRGQTLPSVVLKECVTKKKRNRSPRRTSQRRASRGTSPPLGYYKSSNYLGQNRRVSRRMSYLNREKHWKRASANPRDEYPSRLYNAGAPTTSQDKGDDGCPFFLLNCNCMGQGNNRKKGVNFPKSFKDFDFGMKRPSQGSKWVNGRSKDQRSRVFHIKPQKRISRGVSMKSHGYNAMMFEEEEPTLLSSKKRGCDCNDPRYCSQHKCRKYAKKQWNEMDLRGTADTLEGRRISVCDRCITSEIQPSKKGRQRWSIPNPNDDPFIPSNCKCYKFDRDGRCKCIE